MKENKLNYKPVLLGWDMSVLLAATALVVGSGTRIYPKVIA